MATCLLGMEALWWLVNTVVLATSFARPGLGELLTVIPVSLMGLTLLATFLLLQSPSAGVWLGLVLQAVVVVHAVALLTIFEQQAGGFELFLGLAAAPLLAATRTKMLRL